MTDPITARLRAMKIERRDSTGIGHWETHPVCAEAADIIDKLVNNLAPRAIRTMGPRSPFWNCTVCGASQLTPLDFEHKPDCVLAGSPKPSPDMLAESVGRMKTALTAFIDHYPAGTNPYLDQVVADARTALYGMRPDDRADMIAALLASEREYENGEEVPGDPGCIECTSGVTPDRFNTGLCAHHLRVRALAKAQGRS